LPFIYRDKSQVFLFHDCAGYPSDMSKEYSLNVTPNNFRKQLKWISDNYQIIDPQELLYPQSGESRRKPKALITFDDAFLSIFHEAAPILRSFKVKALVFLNRELFLEGILSSSAYAFRLADPFFS